MNELINDFYIIFQMSTPVYNSIIIGGMMPLVKRIMDNQTANIEFHDFYPEIFQRMGVLRDEMLPCMKTYLGTDPLVGTAKLRYIDEEIMKNEEEYIPIKPVNGLV